MLMLYKCTKCGAEEKIWNSRDGITPFGISCRECGEFAQHEHWEKDVFNPFYSPPDGSRVFVDLTLERAKEKARKQVEFWWEHPEYPMSQRFDNKEDAMYSLANAALEEFAPHSPDLVTAEDYYATYWSITKKITIPVPRFGYE